MHKRCRPRFPHFPLAAPIAVLPLIALAPPVVGQDAAAPQAARPRAAVAPARTAAADAQAFAALRRQWAEIEKQNPQQAIDAYSGFFETNKGLAAGVAVELSSVVAQLYVQGLQNKKKAQEIYDWAIHQYGEAPESTRLLVERARLLGEPLAAGKSVEVTVTPPAVKPAAVAKSPAPKSVTPKTPAKKPPPAKPVAPTAAAVSDDGISVPITGAATKAVSTDALTLARAIPKSAGSAVHGATANDSVAPLGSGQVVPVVGVSEVGPAAPSGEPVRVGAKPEKLTGAPKVEEPRRLPASVAQGIAGAVPITPNLSAPAGAPGVGAVTGTTQAPLLPPSTVGAVKPGHGQAATAATGVTAVTDAAALTPILWSQLKSGARTAEAMWQSGDLNSEIVTRTLNGAKLTYDKGDERVRIALVALLLKHQPAAFEPGKVSQKFKLLLADYYRARKEFKAEALLFEVLDDSRLPDATPAVAALAYPVLERLAWFYEAVGDFAQAGEMQLQVRPYASPEDSANFLLAAARMFGRAGNVKKSEELYTQVAASGDGWTVGLAAWDRANRLIAQDKHDEARKILAQPLTGRYAEQMQIGLTAMLAYSYYRAGEWDAARTISQKTIDDYKALPNPIKDEGLENQVAAAGRYIEWTEKWQKTPLVCEPVWIIETANGPTTRRFTVRSHRPVPITVATQGAVEARVDGAVQDKGYYFETTVVVTWKPEAARKGIEAIITANSTQWPEFKAQVPVRVGQKTEVRKQKTEATPPHSSSLT